MGEPGYGLISSPVSLVHHLKRKLQNPERQYRLIPEQEDIYQLEPEDLIRKYRDMYGITSGDGECFFFYPLCGRNGKGTGKSIRKGFWHPTGRGKKAQETNQIKWAQRNLVYFRGSRKEKVWTDWAMQEYTIESDLVPNFSQCL
ncbi:NAC domain-containing protein 86-like [Punica granatum]|uniref:NAC domain-containing protein 86-like n=1 Tax=Punica granatum TaxID=22663 RepID=A0A6P8D4P0_PUNGR|nr:NAC domain-containing protein 86-like [Punica granatum]